MIFLKISGFCSKSTRNIHKWGIYDPHSDTIKEVDDMSLQSQESTFNILHFKIMLLWTAYALLVRPRNFCQTNVLNRAYRLLHTGKVTPFDEINMKNFKINVLWKGYAIFFRPRNLYFNILLNAIYSIQNIFTTWSLPSDKNQDPMEGPCPFNESSTYYISRLL